jgi:hypothetical protein
VRRGTLCRGGAALLLAFAFVGCPRLPLPPPPVTPTPAPITPVPTPTPPPTLANKRLEVPKLFSGLKVNARLDATAGTTASADRVQDDAYSLDLTVHVKVPKPHQSLASLSKLNAQLATALPELPALLQTAAVSPVFDELYRLKVRSIETNLTRLDALISRHNFYDCETILNLQHPTTKRMAVLIQADMDTDTDGSDPDRMPQIDGSSVTFQPFTSYKWARKTTLANSFIPGRLAKLIQAQQELAHGGSPARQADLKGTIARLKEEISDLNKYAYLLGAADPYIVLPGSMFTAKSKGPFSPMVGDYCLVIYGDTLYPAVVGDVGPMTVLGEASLRICRQIDARSDANNRAVNDLKVTYLLFPGTADRPFAAPDLDKWQTRCEALLAELGGTKGKLHKWDDLTKPKATPAPPPATPAPGATPVPGATPPAGTATPAASPSATPGATPSAPSTPSASPAPHASSAAKRRAKQ